MLDSLPDGGPRPEAQKPTRQGRHPHPSGGVDSLHGNKSERVDANRGPPGCTPFLVHQASPFFFSLLGERQVPCHGKASRNGNFQGTAPSPNFTLPLGRFSLPSLPPPTAAEKRRTDELGRSKGRFPGVPPGRVHHQRPEVVSVDLPRPSPSYTYLDRSTILGFPSAFLAAGVPDCARAANARSWELYPRLSLTPLGRER